MHEGCIGATLGSLCQTLVELTWAARADISQGNPSEAGHVLAPEHESASGDGAVVVYKCVISPLYARALWNTAPKAPGRSRFSEYSPLDGESQVSSAARPHRRSCMNCHRCEAHSGRRPSNAYISQVEAGCRPHPAKSGALPPHCSHGTIEVRCGMLRPTPIGPLLRAMASEAAGFLAAVLY